MDASNCTPSPRFELTGGALCLDFANTWEDRGREESDRLGTYDHLLQFTRESGCLEEAAVRGLEQAARGQEASATVVLSEALQLRDTIYRIFSARAAGRPVDPAWLDQLNGVLGTALGRQRICPEGEGFGWTWEAEDLACPLCPIARSAANLLTAPEVARVRQCDADDCSWLFLDRSRGRSRRWCSMESCGNRAKARRHYRRNRGGR